MRKKKEKEGNWSSSSPKVLVHSHTAHFPFIADSRAASSPALSYKPPWSVKQKCYMLNNPQNEMTCLGKYKKHL